MNSMPRRQHKSASLSGVCRWIVGIWRPAGSFLDQHLFPIGAYGIARGWLSRTLEFAASPYEYELARRRAPSRAPRMCHGHSNAALEALSEQARAWTMPRTPGRRNLARRARRLLLNPRMAPLTATLLGVRSAVQHSGPAARDRTPARSTPIGCCSVTCTVWGPLAGDDLEEWAAPNGPTEDRQLRLVAVRARSRPPRGPPHPYWPGGAIVLESGRAPRAVGLLDGLSAADLH